jgi:hypothetical protein
LNPLEVATLTVADGFTLSGGNFDASASTGTFQTGSGAISLNGPTLSTLQYFTSYGTQERQACFRNIASTYFNQ